MSVAVLFFVGMLLSAFFSGSETGLYRATRVRLVLDSLGGDRISQGLLWLINNPTLFVATSLIGNNFANYLVSYSIVAGTQLLLGGNHAAAELIAPIVMAPVVFVYGELLPKSLFYIAPNRLLRRTGPLFLVCSVVFSPISGLLWLMGRFIQRTLGKSPELVRMQLARQEIRQLMEEGHDVGILSPAQRQAAQALFDSGNRPVSRYGTPPSRMTTVKLTDPISRLLRLARRHRTSELLVEAEGSRQLVGYVRVIDLHLQKAPWTTAIRALPKFSSEQSHVAVLMQMQQARESLAELVNRQQKTVAIVSLRRLIEPLYQEG